ncbi:Karyopherin transporter [Diplodia seriata]
MSMSIEELDATVRAFYEGRGDTQKQAQASLNQFKENPDAWLLVDKILQDAHEADCWVDLGLQVLDNVIMTRWKVLPRDQCQGIRNFVVNFIIQTSSTEESLRNQRTLLNKLNLVLVSILKQEWPHNWPTFINEIISSCHSSLPICENNMVILRLLSEEVFDYSADQMTSSKTKELKQSMCDEFTSIYQLCSEVLRTAEQASLIKATLETLLRFLNWIPLGYIFETPPSGISLIETLRSRFLEVPEFRNITLKCLTEIAGLHTEPAYNEKLVQMFTETLTEISKIIPLSMDLKSTYAQSNSRDQEFVQNLALFLCNYFSMHLSIIENLPNRDFLIHGHFYLIRISQIDDREIFKICLEYWTKLVSELYDEMQQLPIGDINPLINMGIGGMANGGARDPALLANYPLRKHKYAEVLSNLRQVMIEKMVRPEEVLIVENDEGEIVREFVKESDTIQLYKSTRECLVFLTHLDVNDTEQIMSEKLARQVDGSEWSWPNCNTLCWAIGSISGAMNEETEKRFLVTVIKDLLGLTEMKRGKDNKAVVASNIMYIVGQYPRFLKAHWKFLKTVVNKLFEFMHETHEGKSGKFPPLNADMACDTFIKIANKCRRHFVALQPGETEPFIDEIVRNLRKITMDLSPQQIHTFYEACGYMISAQGQKSIQERLIQELMSLPNAAWDSIIQSANTDPSILQDGETIKIIGNIMKTNVAACSSIGSYFYPQIGRIYLDMLTMFRAASGLIDEGVQRDGNIATKMPKVRGLRTIKKEILKLINTYVERADDLDMVHNTLVPGLLEAVLLDYKRNVPDAREAEVLNVMTTIINKLHSLMEDQIMNIMDAVFECTLDMINKDFSEYPDHRVEFFKLLRTINLRCFPALLKLDARSFKFVIDSCMWASKHDNREVEGAGLMMCFELISNMSETDPGTCNTFFQSFYTTILQDVFFVLTDNDHKAGFKHQSMLLAKMFWLVESGKISGPIYTPEMAPAGTSNRDFLKNFTGNLLANAFPNLQTLQISNFIDGLLATNSDLNRFKLILRDFLISLKEFSGDNAELFAEEREQAAKAAKDQERERAMKVGGLLKPSELEDDELKFGKHIQKRQLDFPEYAASFVDYKALKKLIKKLSATPVIYAQNEPSLGDPQTSLQANKATFFFRLERELEKVNKLYLQKEAELKLRLSTLLEKKRSLQSQPIPVSKLSSKYVILEEAFRLFSNDLNKLQQFVEINATAFSKILKKWDKTSKSRTKELYISRAVEVQPCFNREVISDLSDQATTSLLDFAAWAEGEQMQYTTSVPSEFPNRLHDADTDADPQILQTITSGNISGVEEWISRVVVLPDARDRITKAFLATAYDAPESALKVMLDTNFVDLDQGDDVNARNCLHKAAISGRSLVLKIGLEGNADVRASDVYGRIPLHYACMHGHVGMIQDLVTTAPDTVDFKDHDGFTPLIHSIVHNHLSCVQSLLQHNARIDPTGESDHIPLNLACQHGLQPIVELLLHANPQILPDAEGLYPQHLVARSGKNPRICLLLRDYGVNLDQPDKLYQWTPLFHAASEGHVVCLKTLLDCSVSVHVKDEKGLTAMYYATWEGHLECMKLLASVSQDNPMQPPAAPAPPMLSAGPPPSSTPQPMAMEVDGIPDLSLPPPIIPIRRYGHNFLENKTFVVINFGALDSEPIRFYEDSKYPAARLTIASKSSDLIPRNITLPMSEENKVISFQVDNLETFSIDFDVYPTFGAKVIARTEASSTVFRNRESSSGFCNLGLFDPRLRTIGRIKFQFNIVTPFPGPPLEITHFATYWKATSQLDESPSALITGSSLSGSYVRLFVQMTCDGVPVLCPQWKVKYGRLGIPVSRLTSEEFLYIGVENGGGESALAALANTPAHDISNIHKILASSYVSLKEAINRLPVEVRIELHILYPNRVEEETLRLGPTPNINTFADTLLNIVFDDAHMCTALNWKQPNYPVLLGNELGADPIEAAADSQKVHSSGRTTISVKEAVQVAQNNNLMGLICSSRLLNLAPALIESVKTAGLVLITDLSTQQSTLPDQPSSDRIDGYFDREGVLHFNETIDI